MPSSPPLAPTASTWQLRSTYGCPAVGSHGRHRQRRHPGSSRLSFLHRVLGGPSGGVLKDRRRNASPLLARARACALLVPRISHAPAVRRASGCWPPLSALSFRKTAVCRADASGHLGGLSRTSAQRLLAFAVGARARARSQPAKPDTAGLLHHSDARPKNVARGYNRGQQSFKSWARP